MIRIIILTGILIAAPAMAQPIIKRGICPEGTQGDGSFCNPLHDGVRVIPKTGTCPEGYHASGDGCAGYPGAHAAVPLPPGGTCPSGWHASGGSCVSYH